jgi:hypothetical protein
MFVNKLDIKPAQGENELRVVKEVELNLRSTIVDNVLVCGNSLEGRHD